MPVGNSWDDIAGAPPTWENVQGNWNDWEPTTTVPFLYLPDSGSVAKEFAIPIGGAEFGFALSSNIQSTVPQINTILGDIPFILETESVLQVIKSPVFVGDINFDFAIEHTAQFVLTYNMPSQIEFGSFLLAAILFEDTKINYVGDVKFGFVADLRQRTESNVQFCTWTPEESIEGVWTVDSNLCS